MCMMRIKAPAPTERICVVFLLCFQTELDQPISPSLHSFAEAFAVHVSLEYATVIFPTFHTRQLYREAAVLSHFLQRSAHPAICTLTTSVCMTRLVCYSHQLMHVKYAML